MNYDYDFDEETVRAQKCAAKGDWKGFKKIFEKEENTKKLLDPLDLFGNTAIHVVAGSGNATLLKELLQMLPDETDRRKALLMPNEDGNTLLHEAAFLINETETVDVIMEFGKKMPDNGTMQLLENKNKINETPVFRAAMYGNLKMLKHIHMKYHRLEATYFPPSVSRNNHRPILHACLLMLHFEVALWLVKNLDKSLTSQNYEILNESKEEINPGISCFQLLSNMPMFFESTDTLEMGMKKKLVYYFLPEEGYELELDDDAGNNLFKSTRDTESGPPDDEIRKSSKSIFTILNFSAWKLLLQAKAFHWVNEIWGQKKRHKFAEHLAKLLVKYKLDSSNRYSYSLANQALCLLPHYPSNVTKKKRKIELKQRVEEEEKIKVKMNLEEEAMEGFYRETSWETPLFLAAGSGIIEVVKIIVDDYPEAITHVNRDGLNILHVAIKHRQLEIYEFIVNNPKFHALVQRISNNGRTILHQAASIEYYKEPAKRSVAFQLQDELNLYHQTRSDLPPYFLRHCDEEGLTAEDLFNIEHAEMHEKAKQWMKETAQSCSTVAVLIAGAFFASAYTTQKETEPVLHHNDIIESFISMDVVAFAFSLVSVVVFLSIRTSSMNLWDFQKALPRRLKLGFFLLFCSLIATLWSFGGTIMLTIKYKVDNKTTVLIYSLAFVIVSTFGLTQLPISKMFQEMFLWVKPWNKKLLAAKDYRGDV